MLSILIPNYNNIVVPLVKELNKQALSLGIIYEIIILDDCSEKFVKDNTQINNFSNCIFFRNEKNLGRTKTREILAQKSKFDNLLFLDSDVFPKENNFIKNYINEINNFSIIIGGCCYSGIKVNKNKTLRLVYGINREQASLHTRELNPYQYVFSGNFLIKKDVFLSTNYKENKNLYGLDIYFAYKLLKNKIVIKHIENEIIHYGLEENEDFLLKSLSSVANRKKLLKDYPEIINNNSLLKHYNFLKKYKLCLLFSFFFRLTNSLLKKNILGPKPSLFLFDIYRLGYICSID